MKNLKLSRILMFVWPLFILLGLWMFKEYGGGTSIAGEKLYTQHCANCHMDDGTGLRKLIPSLLGAEIVVGDGNELACLIRYGVVDTTSALGASPFQGMPANEKLKEIEIMSVINYIRSSWGNDVEKVSFEQVKRALAECGGK